MQNLPPRTFSKQLRLLRPGDFDAVFKCRCSTADGGLVVYAAPNDCGHARLGLAVSRKVGRAVERNRWKRALREAFRLRQHELPSLDLVCLPRPGGTADVQRLLIVLPMLVGRLERKLQSPRGPSTATGTVSTPGQTPG